MKKLIYIFMILFVSCSKVQEAGNTCTACGIEEPQKNLPWLAELIKKAETDKTGNYKGIVWLVKHNERDFFITNMKFESGGMLYWIFDCPGNHYGDREGENCPLDSKHFTLEEGDLPPLKDLKLDIVVYSNVPF